MGDDWFEAFTDVVISPLRAIPGAEALYASDDLIALNSASTRGRLTPNSTWRETLWDSFLYQRHHLDALGGLLVDGLLADERRRLVVLDIGCGAATAAIALSQCFLEWGRHDGFDYVGVDHNLHALHLAARMLQESDVLAEVDNRLLHPNLATGVATTAEWIGPRDVVLVTASFLFQASLSEAWLRQLARHLQRLATAAAESGADVIFAGVDAAGATGNLDRLLVLLRELKMRRKTVLREVVDLDIQFVSMHPEDGERLQKLVPRLDNIDRWIYRLRPGTPTR